MPEYRIVYWRDIPAQVIVGKGRRAVKVALSERFLEAIDRCAMKTNSIEADDYLSHWRKSEYKEVSGTPDIIARREANKIEEEFDDQKLKKLVKLEGWDLRDDVNF